MTRHVNPNILAKMCAVLVGLLISSALPKAFQIKKPSDHASLSCQPGRGVNLKDYIPGVDKVKNVRTLVLALSVTSRYCSESAGFYRMIEQERAKDVRLVAVFPYFVPEKTVHSYLQDEELHVDEVKQLLLQDVGIRGTPTLMLLDGNGVVLDAWMGKLSPGEEDEVIAAVKHPPEIHPQVADGPEARDVVIYPESRWEAVKILRITDAGQDVLPGRYLYPYLPGQRFLAGDNWEKDLSFTLKNRTSKQIVFLGFDFMFSENDSWDDAATWWLNLGKVPEIACGAFHPPEDNVPQGTGKPLEFGPGTEMTVSLANYADTIKAWIEERGHPLASIKTCALLVTQCFFEDGMRASPIKYEYIDRSMPNAWTKREDFYFPGELNPMSRVPTKLDLDAPDEDF